MSDAPRPRLPDAALAPAAGGDPVPLRLARHATVLALLGDSLGAADRAFVDALAAAEPSIREWDGRVFAIAPHDASPLATLHDPQHVVASAAGVAAPALVVADQWGDVHVAEPARDGVWYSVQKIEQTVRWLAIRCAG